MTQVHADHNQILCLFEDVQYHLSEMGFPSWIKAGKLTVTHNDIDYTVIDCTIDDNTVRFSDGLYPSDERYKTLGNMTSVQRTAFRLLYELLPMYNSLSYDIIKEMEND